MVSSKTQAVIWAKGAGRCYFCNAPLIGDLISGNEDSKFGFVAHIVAEKPGGPRGDSVRSPLLADDPKNLMLLCSTHHKLIDVDEAHNYLEQRLLDMKAEHERRIEITTSLTQDRQSYILRYGAKIGEHTSPVSFTRVRTAMLPDRYPANNQSISIELNGGSATDSEENYWKLEQENLATQFDRKIKQRIEDREIEHLSVFSLAPIPLLVQLGSLLGDIIPADIYQLHREPSGWSWAKTGPRISFVINKPQTVMSKIALKIGLSATVSDDRIKAVLGEDASIWSLSTNAPGNDIMRHPEDLEEFRHTMRGLYDQIKAVHGEGSVIHMFPAVPVSAAVEIGRVRMPKADLPITIYDQKQGTGFVPRVTIA